MIHILKGDSLDLLKQLPSNSVNCIITSPPYYQLRDYGTATWEGGNPDCKHEYQTGGRNPENSGLQLTNGGTLFTQYKDICKDCGAKRIDKQIGLENTPSQYITKLVEIFHEAKRVLRNDGTMWVNIGDSYNGSGKGSSSGGKGEHSLLQQKNTGSLSIVKPCNIKGIKKKDLIGIPWMLAFALRDDGWYLRQDIIWHKPSPMPESVDDRCTRAHEYVFLLSKKSKYYYNQEAIKEPVKSSSISRLIQKNMSNQTVNDKLKSNGKMKAVGNLNNRNKRSVWKVAQVSYPSAHFACVDELTECLTNNGWKKYCEILHNDKILTYNMKLKMTEFENLIEDKIYIYNYENEMIECKGRFLDILMTPNHRNIVLHRNQHNHIEQIKLAEELNHSDKIKVSSKFNNKFKSILSNNHYALLGWFFTDGYIDKYRVSIYQNAGRKANMIRKILKSENIDFYEYKRFRKINFKGKSNGKYKWNLEFRIKPKYHRYFRDYCSEIKGYRKTPLIKLLFAENDKLMSIYNSMIDGDGSRRKDNKSRKNRACFIQKNNNVSNFFEILCILLGKRAITSKRKYAGSSLHNITYVTNQEYNDLRGINGKKTLINKKFYKGIVWCPKTRNGTFVAKRNGKIFITGNTYPPKLIEPMIIAGCPEGGTVLDMFGGSGTTALVSDRLNRNCISIDISDKYCQIQYNRIMDEIGLYVMDTENYVLISDGVPPQLLGKPILP